MISNLIFPLATMFSIVFCCMNAKCDCKWKREKGQVRGIALLESKKEKNCKLVVTAG